LIDNAKAYILDLGVQNEPEEKQLQDRRNNQRYHYLRVSAKLIELLLNESKKARIE
jgi:hypothetical protein